MQLMGYIQKLFWQHFTGGSSSQPVALADYHKNFCMYPQTGFMVTWIKISCHQISYQGIILVKVQI
jgi:hypothetical protein